MSNLIKHAIYLLENDGSCDGGYAHGCNDCFVPKMMEDEYFECSREAAYECAEKFLREANEQGICISIW